MSRFKGVVLVTALIAVTGPALATDLPFLVVTTTTSQTALFAPFVAYSDAVDIDSAISVSNILGAPVGLQPPGMNDKEGTIELYIYSSDGSLLAWESADNSVGNGVLTSDGKLSPGKTWTVLLSQLLNAAGALPDKDDVFSGYFWVVANFDAIQGTVTVLYPDFDFAMGMIMLPAMDLLTFGGFAVTVPDIVGPPQP